MKINLCLGTDLLYNKNPLGFLMKINLCLGTDLLYSVHNNIYDLAVDICNIITQHCYMITYDRYNHKILYI